MTEPQASPVASERLSPDEKLRRRRDYQRCYRLGRRRHGSLVVIYACSNECRHPRFGITASRRVGCAVVRQRLRRRVREIYRRWPDRGRLPEVDLVVHLKPAAAAADFETLRSELDRLFGAVARRGR